MTESIFIRVVYEPRRRDDNTEDDWIFKLYVDFIRIFEIHVHLDQPRRECGRSDDIIEFHFYAYSIQIL